MALHTGSALHAPRAAAAAASRLSCMTRVSPARRLRRVVLQSAAADDAMPDELAPPDMKARAMHRLFADKPKIGAEHGEVRRATTRQLQGARHLPRSAASFASWAAALAIVDSGRMPMAPIFAVPSDCRALAARLAAEHDCNDWFGWCASNNDCLAKEAFPLVAQMIHRRQSFAAGVPTLPPYRLRLSPRRRHVERAIEAGAFAPCAANLPSPVPLLSLSKKRSVARPCKAPFLLASKGPRL